MINRITSTFSLALVLACLMLQACGLKGDLYLEPAAAKAPAAEAVNDSEASPEAGAAEVTSPAADVAPE
jgi:predicted small lipoprotein YifL